jgi:ribosome-binding protein aMBF1 (putative translation factor)
MTVTAKEDPKRAELFRDALRKMSQISLSYQQGQIKHMAYAEKIDATIEASGWSREDFQAEVERRRKSLDQK